MGILGLLVVASLLAALTRHFSLMGQTGEIVAIWLAFLVFGLIMWVAPEYTPPSWKEFP